MSNVLIPCPRKYQRAHPSSELIQAMASTGEARLAEPHSCYPTAVSDSTPEQGRAQDRAPPELWRMLHQNSQGTLALGQQCWQLSSELTP